MRRRTPREAKSQMSDSGEFPREILFVDHVCGRLTFPQISSLPTFSVLWDAPGLQGYIWQLN